MLQRLGAEATAVRDGKQAADLFEAHYARGDGGRGQTSGPFTCVLMDCQVWKPFIYAKTQVQMLGCVSKSRNFL